MLAVVVVVSAVVGVSILFVMTVPVTVWADTPVTVAMAGLVEGEGHAGHGRDGSLLAVQEWLNFFSSS